MISTAIDQAETDRDLALIGAGVLESLVVAHPADVIPRLAASAAVSPKVARAASSLCVDDLPPEYVDLIDRLSLKKT